MNRVWLKEDSKSIDPEKWDSSRWRQSLVQNWSVTRSSPSASRPTLDRTTRRDRRRATRPRLEPTPLHSWEVCQRSEENLAEDLKSLETRKRRAGWGSHPRQGSNIIMPFAVNDDGFKLPTARFWGALIEFAPNQISSSQICISANLVYLKVFVCIFKLSKLNKRSNNASKSCRNLKPDGC